MTRFLLSACALAAVGCTSYVPLTVEMMRKADFTADDLRYVQFYVDREVSFERRLKPAEHGEKGGGGIGLYTEQIVIDEKTPGIAEEVTEKGVENDKPIENERKRLTLWVSFEAGTRFPFVADGSGGFNLEANDRKLVVGDKLYDVTWEGAGRPMLLIEEDAGIEKKKLRGRRLSD